MKVTIEHYINFFKIKYLNLDELIKNSSIIETKCGKMKLFINLDSILNIFYSDFAMATVKAIKDDERNILSSLLINVAAHYRHYFWSRWQVTTEIYFYTLNKKIKNKRTEDYGHKLYKKRRKIDERYSLINEYLMRNIKYLALISIYVKDVYVLSSDGLDPSILPYYIIKEKRNKNECNLVLTNDKFDYQLLNLKNTFILRMRGDKSKIVERKDIYNHYFKNIKYKERRINPMFYPIILAFSGIKSRDVGSIKGYGFVNLYKKLIKAIDSGYLNEKDYYNIKSICRVLDLDDDVSKDAEDRFKDISLKYNYKTMSFGDKESIEFKLINREDNIGIMELNSTYFKDNNIALVELSEGVKQ